MLVNHACLRFAESDEVDDVTKNLDKARVCWFVEVREREILDAAFEQQLAEGREEAHEVACVRGEDAIGVLAVKVVGCEPHGRRDYIARRVCEQFREPLEDLLDLLRIGLAQVFHGEADANVADATCDLGIFLEEWSV